MTYSLDGMNRRHMDYGISRARSGRDFWLFVGFGLLPLFVELCMIIVDVKTGDPAPSLLRFKLYHYTVWASITYCALWAIVALISLRKIDVARIAVFIAIAFLVVSVGTLFLMAIRRHPAGIVYLNNW